MKLVHAADIHLGRRRLDGRLPETDFRDAFLRIAQAAIDEAADAVILAGDLFDQPQVQPAHLRHAQEVLRHLQSARIPVLAIEGNHDKSPSTDTSPSWLDFLADDDLIRLLGMRFGPEGPILTPWERGTRRGAYLDLNGVRFVGAGYLGAATPFRVRQIVASLEPNRCHVLLLHAGPDYFVGEGGGFSRLDLEAIRQRVTYLALGHIHKPMIHGGWACNPGSPENCDVLEARYDHHASGTPQARGYAIVQLDPGPPARLTSLTLHSLPRRPVLDLDLDCTPFGNKLKDGAETLAAAAAARIRAASPPPETVVLLRLLGALNLRRIAVDPETLAHAVEQQSGVFAVTLDLSQLNLPPNSLRPDSPFETLSRDQIERFAIHDLVQQEHLWGLDGSQTAIASLFHELKDMVRTGSHPDVIADRIARDPLVDLVRAAMENAVPASPASKATEPPEPALFMPPAP